jgi:uncharacterized protein YjdB
VSLAGDDKITDAFVNTPFYISNLKPYYGKDPVGVYPLVITTKNGGCATVAMAVYDDKAPYTVFPTKYSVAATGGVAVQGAFVRADTKNLSVSLSAASTANLAAMANARAFTWCRSDTEITEVTEGAVESGWSGTVASEGRYEYWVKPAGADDSFRVYRYADVYDAQLRPKQFSIKITASVNPVAPGGRVALKTVFSGESLTASEKAVSWSIASYGGTSAKVASTGLFTAGAKEGVVTVRATSAYLPSTYADFAVTVAKPVTKVSIPIKKLHLKKGASFTTPVNAYSPGGDSAKLTWTSSNRNVASVNSSTGVVKALKSGTAVVTAKTLNGASAKFTVKVVSKAKKVKKIQIKGYKKTMKRGTAAQLKISITPADATISKISIRSSKPSVLSVNDSGKLTAKKKGTASISVVAGNKSQKIKISVK